MEMDRLLLIHDIVTRVTGGLYQAPIDKDKTKLILDIGTGTGICETFTFLSFACVPITNLLEGRYQSATNSQKLL